MSARLTDSDVAARGVVVDETPTCPECGQKAPHRFGVFAAHRRLVFGDGDLLTTENCPGAFTDVDAKVS